jgi:hypothetical protein
MLKKRQLQRAGWRRRWEQHGKLPALYDIPWEQHGKLPALYDIPAHNNNVFSTRSRLYLLTAILISHDSERLISELRSEFALSSIWLWQSSVSTLSNRSGSPLCHRLCRPSGRMENGHL